MTEEQIREIARQTGFHIIDSAIWSQLAKRFIAELLTQIAHEKTHDCDQEENLEIDLDGGVSAVNEQEPV